MKNMGVTHKKDKEETQLKYITWKVRSVWKTINKIVPVPYTYLNRYIPILKNGVHKHRPDIYMYISVNKFSLNMDISGLFYHDK